MQRSEHVALAFSESVCTHNLLPALVLINALPLLNTTFPPSTLVTNLISSNPSSNSPVLQMSVINLSPGLTGAWNLAEKCRRLAGSDLLTFFKIEWAATLYVNRPCMIAPPKPIALPWSAVT